ncbi:hypothetical protein CONLIGDRAFT_84590 [Coniochaeta ligniaria NRRL 30616]|uniref:SP-RING-type domain-containing protein n=1 Tax=Coniochaeta ligniaria NRRL 30616 TaxID=1408157 RepID=A0A1J7IVR1_9PEZI|nr:hypothetical protein CONLIGDRAFT_84590 [Coniochaeta ligniaria NRRL 30616]
MAPGRLLQNSRQRAGPSSSSAPRNHRVDSSNELPPYEPPSQPLNDAARRALAQISNNRSTRKFDDHLKKSTELIRDAVGATNDRAWENHATLQQRVEKLAQAGKDKTEADLELENYVAKLGEDVSATTGQLEAGLRDVIDYRVELEDEPAVLDMVRGELESQAQNWRPREGANMSKKKEPRPSAADGLGDAMNDDEDAGEEENEEDSEMREPEDRTALTGVNDVLQKVRQSKAEDWTRLDMGQRYAKHNDYIMFKRTLHDAQHPTDDATLPHASAWFGPDGRPVLSKIGETDAPGEDDDELQIAGEVRTFRCPLSLQVMEEPYSNNKCKHTFDKKAIVDFITTNNGVVQCPETGCTQQLSIQDFFLDKILLRKIKRQQQADAQKDKDDFGMEQDEEEQVDEDGDTVITGTQRKIKPERRRNRQVVDDIEDDE